MLTKKLPIIIKVKRTTFCNSVTEVNVNKIVIKILQGSVCFQLQISCSV